MIQHLHSIICVRSILDKNRGLASYVDIIEGVTLKKSKILSLPPFTLVSKYWVKDGIEDGQTLEIEFSKKKSTQTKRNVLQEMSFPLERKGENILIQLEVNNLAIEEAGLWEFEVRWRLKESGNWKKGAVIPVKVSTEE